MLSGAGEVREMSERDHKVQACSYKVNVFGGHHVQHDDYS